jgi:hypothetical protein
VVDTQQNETPAQLAGLGLTSYQARTCLALLRRDPSTAALPLLAQEVLAASVSLGGAKRAS